MARPKREILVYFDYFRAFAILCVIIGHCYGDWSRDTVGEIVLADLLTGGSALFVFVSGFFFQHLFNRDFDFRGFLRKKAQNVLVPYLILMTAYLALMLAVNGAISFPVALGIGPASDSAMAVVLNVVTGARLTAYWYIPFIMVVFLASPLFRALARQDDRIVAAAVLLGLLGAMYFERPMQNLNPLHSFLYFAPFYLGGILYAKQAAAVNGWIDRNLWALVLLLLTLLLHMANTGQIGNLLKSSPFAPVEHLDIMVPQKTLLILVLIGLTRWLARYEIASLTFLAHISFPLFFIHPWALLLQDKLIGAYFSGFPGFLARTVFVIALSILTISALKTFLGARSRLLIGG